MSAPLAASLPHGLAAAAAAAALPFSATAARADCGELQRRCCASGPCGGLLLREQGEAVEAHP